MKEKALLRKAAYWLTDYASCFVRAEEPGARVLRAKLLRIAAQCRKAGHDPKPQPQSRT